MPCPGEGVVGVRHAERQPDGAVRGDHLEEHAEDRVTRSLRAEGVMLDDADQEDAEDEVPDIVGELDTKVDLDV